MANDARQGTRSLRSAGCLGALVGVPVLLFLFAISSLAECLPVTSCQRSIWREVLAPATAVTLLAALCGYWAARWWQRR